MTTYVVDLTIPKNTPEDNPVKAEVVVKEDVIVQIIVQIPPGVRGMARTRAFIGTYQIFPRPPGQKITGDGVVFRYSEFLVLPHRDTVIRIEGDSPGSRYDHTITWHITALTREQAMWYHAIDRLINLFARLFRVRLE